MDQVNFLLLRILRPLCLRKKRTNLAPTYGHKRDGAIHYQKNHWGNYNLRHCSWLGAGHIYTIVSQNRNVILFF